MFDFQRSLQHAGFIKYPKTDDCFSFVNTVTTDICMIDFQFHFETIISVCFRKTNTNGDNCRMSTIDTTDYFSKRLIK